MADSVKEVIKECEKCLGLCDSLDKELEAIKHGVDFLLNEYKTNKKWFREEPGRVTIKDVIKTCFEFGWASRRQFEK